MKPSLKTIKTLAVTAAIMTACSVTNAQTKNGLGIGVIVGEPTGISIKKWIDNTHAVDGAIAISPSGDDAFNVHADYLIHSTSSTISPPELKGSAPWYYGLGARIRTRNGDTHFGVRVPVGIDYLFADSPLDFFGEVGPVLDIAPDTALDFNVAIGLRYFF
jgi:hypothetical protein